MGRRRYEAIVLGASSGGMDAVRTLIEALPESFSLPVIIVQHRSPDTDGMLEGHLAAQCRVKVKEADEKEAIESGTVYVAPANYHLLVETDRTLSLSVDEHVNYARPSIDVLFETAADAYGPRVVGIILTGANSDGANGLRDIKEKGGLTIVEDPKTAFSSAMPQAAVDLADPQFVLPLSEIKAFLLGLHQETSQ